MFLGSCLGVKGSAGSTGALQSSCHCMTVCIDEMQWHPHWKRWCCRRSCVGQIGIQSILLMELLSLQHVSASLVTDGT